MLSGVAASAGWCAHPLVARLLRAIAQAFARIPAMPVIGISVDRLDKLLRGGVDMDKVAELLSYIGCDVEGVADVLRYQSRHSDYVIEVTPQESLPLTDPTSGFSGSTPEEVWQPIGRERVVRLDLLPVRPDIFDAGGLARALRGYMGKETGLPQYSARPASWRVDVDPRITDPQFRRPLIQCAIVRNLSMDEELLRAVMRLQENLHWALCRDRKFASIGAYDLATLESPIRYTLVDPDSFRFTPLFWSQREPVSPRVMLAEHPKGVGYAHLVEGLPLLPALLSANGNVLSLPPIINAEETKLTLNTRDVLLDVTGSNAPVVERALSILATSLVELDPAGAAYIECVTMAYPDREVQTPALATQTFLVDPAYAARLIGVEASREQIAEYLRRMRHGVEDGGTGLRAGQQAEGDGRGVPSHQPPLTVTVAAYRNDIMHEVDLIEDIAIAYGYHNMPHTLVPTFTAGEGLKLNWRSRRAAAAMCGLGFAETLSLVLTNERDHCEKLRREVPARRVTVANPASSDQTMLRTNLYSCLLELLSMNTDHPLPQRVFEVGDVATYDWPVTGSADSLSAAGAQMDGQAVRPTKKEHDGQAVRPTGDRPTELRVIAGAICATRAGYADGRSALDALLHELGYHVDGEARDVQYRAADNPSALPGRAAAVYVSKSEDGSQKSEGGSQKAEAKPASDESQMEPFAPLPIGEVFEVHPEVLGHFKLASPVVLFSVVLGPVQYH